MVSDAIIPLISSVIGGALVLAGTFFAKRSEDRRVWLIRLQEAAGDLATSYFQEVAAINDARRAGAEQSSVPTATYVIDRQKALGRFRTLPWSGEFEPQRQEMGSALHRVRQAWGDTSTSNGWRSITEHRARGTSRYAAAEDPEALGRRYFRSAAARTRTGEATHARRSGSCSSSWQRSAPAGAPGASPLGQRDP